jgi:glucose/arabinose dehydrogenase
VAVTHAGDERLFITLQGGAIVIFDGERVLPQPFLDISGRVLSGGERGLLSVTFHPGYAQNGRFFVDYTDLGGDTVVSRFAVSGGNPDAALPGSERVLLAIDQPFANHNGGQLQFGPDGYLYVGMGDGGSGNDPFCFAQDDGTLLGKLLRLDVDQNVSTAPFYGIPADNPHRGPGAPLDEIWAEGLRNPWRFSFDRSTGDLFIGDVGQGDREEIDRQPAGSPGGENYGWKMMEGDLCLGSTAGCSFAVPGCNAPAYTAPILTYGRDGGRCAVIGGYVYRGLRIPALYGHYLYGDLCAGTLWAARQVGGAWQAEELGPTAQQLTSFGEELSGEIVLAASNSIYRLTGPPPPSTCTPGPTTLCLQGGRFRATLNWRGAQGNPAAAHAEPLTADSGFFRFNNPDNPEVFVKVLEACDPPFRRFWVFAAGLTNVEASLEVADTDSGQVRVYFNPLGRPFQPIQDTQAFATCP